MSSQQHHPHRLPAGVGRLLAVLTTTLLITGGAVWTAVQPAAAQEPTATPGQTIPPEGTPFFLPFVAVNGTVPTPVPPQPPNSFGSVQVKGGSLGWPAYNSPDVNLLWRGYAPTTAYLGLVNYGGDTDDQAPQMAGIFTPPRLPGFLSTHQVYDWNWNCNPPPQGCRGQPLTWPYPVTLLELAATPGEPLAIASRGPSIAGDYKAMVLYAEETRLTVTYTHDDSPANGYMIHFEDVAVNPGLVALYRQLDAAGRKQLPALRNGETWGTAASGSIKIAVRDRGSFMDPRACKDWWMDYRSQCFVQLQRPAGWHPQGWQP